MTDPQPSAFSLQPIVLILASLLDYAIGDPRWIPHPVRIMGSAISKTEELLRKSEEIEAGRLKKGRVNKIKGIFLALLIVGSTFGITWLIVDVLLDISNISTLLHYCSTAFTIYLASTTIAARELLNSSKKVILFVKEGDLASAKESLSMIVGRDTENLSEKGILRATIETLSENLSDGVIAPLFYLTIGGLPLAMSYKAINTMDSMVGYKNDKYKDFGWAAARLDDIANYIPARISGIVIGIASFFVTRSFFSAASSLKTMLSDSRKHLSPNAGVPEAAIAGALGVKLGGPSTYNGIEINKPYIGVEKTKDYLTASEKALDIVKISSLIGITIAAGVLCIRNIL